MIRKYIQAHIETDGYIKNNTRLYDNNRVKSHKLINQNNKMNGEKKKNDKCVCFGLKREDQMPKQQQMQTMPVQT
ncbi:hypothetical protein EUTSA_v10011913mg [Eutrema salsugineum]|uniref:Uncharacterized protein n=1 Tax=Eutrema salsugineum TaxID=72664 RepID=V4KRD2_EUTSA|nr:hypothetical protein EUTSA_v10011913mg [Eutrema salsugineum]